MRPGDRSVDVYVSKLRSKLEHAIPESRIYSPVALVQQFDRAITSELDFTTEAENALRFLGELGNPYKAIGVDPKGSAAIDWGVYGIPESYLVGPDGTILYKRVGFTDPQLGCQRGIDSSFLRQGVVDERDDLQASRFMPDFRRKCAEGQAVNEHGRVIWNPGQNLCRVRSQRPDTGDSCIASPTE